MPRKLTASDVDDLISRYVAGENQSQLAAAFDVTQATISRWVIKRGAQRTRSDALRLQWNSMTPDQRSAQVSAAHAAVRGMNRTQNDLARRAIGKQRTQSSATADELAVIEALAGKGIYGTGQQAVSKYNLDIGIETVAVELFGGGWHAHGRHRARLPKRVKDLADAGWNLLIAWTHASHPLVPAKVAEDAAAYLERSRRDPAFRRQYRVIWGDGQLIAAGGVDDDKLTLIPTGIRGIYTRRR